MLDSRRTISAVAAATGVAVVIVFASLLVSGYHTIEERHVGVYRRFGAQLDAYTEPGWHMKLPVFTEVHQVLVEQQTDFASDIYCVTSNKIEISFPKIHIVNRLPRSAVLQITKQYGFDYDKELIFDRLKTAVQHFCANNTAERMYTTEYANVGTGLLRHLNDHEAISGTAYKILDVRVQQPVLPAAQTAMFAATELKKIELLYETENSKTEQETARRKEAVATAEERAKSTVANISNQRLIDAKLAEQTIANIDNNMTEARASVSTAAEVQRKKEGVQYLNENYVRNEAMRAMITNTKFYFSSMPNFLPANILT